MSVYCCWKRFCFALCQHMLSRCQLVFANRILQALQWHFLLFFVNVLLFSFKIFVALCAHMCSGLRMSLWCHVCFVGIRNLMMLSGLARVAPSRTYGLHRRTAQFPQNRCCLHSLAVWCLPALTAEEQGSLLKKIQWNSYVLPGGGYRGRGLEIPDLWVHKTTNFQLWSLMRSLTFGTWLKSTTKSCFYIKTSQNHSCHQKMVFMLFAIVQHLPYLPTIVNVTQNYAHLVSRVGHRKVIRVTTCSETPFWRIDCSSVDLAQGYQRTLFYLCVYACVYDRLFICC